jgi:deoxyribose-phosphate aldolase
MTSSPANLTAAGIAKLIDHALLRPDAAREDIAQLCREARACHFHSVCVNPVWVPLAHESLAGSGVAVCCVAGFPFGAQLTETKAMEARSAIRQGATETDMVINLGALKSGDDDAVRRDIQQVVQACRDGHALCKVILEMCLLTDTEKTRACKLAVEAGADFVKTSTGFSKGGATVEDVALLARIAGARGLGVKASGGIRSLADLMKMVAAGATRIGTSSGVKILREAAGENPPDGPAGY